MGEEFDRYRATFVIQGDDLDFEVISNALMLSPTHTHRKGDLGHLRETYPRDMWALTAPIPNAEPFDSHLRWLSNQLEPGHNFIIALKDKANIYIFCAYTTHKGQSELSIPPEAMAIFGKLGIPIDISILA